MNPPSDAVTAETTVNRAVAYPLTYLFVLGGYMLTERSGWAAALVRDDRGVRTMLAAFIAVTTVCFAVFLAYPTVYPRPAWDGGGFVGWPLAFIYGVDLPRNCLPSGHVTAAFLTAFSVRRRHPKFGAALVFWAAVISVSTLTTKQHYLWDVITGVLLSVVGYEAAHLYFDRPGRAARAAAKDASAA